MNKIYLILCMSILFSCSQNLTTYSELEIIPEKTKKEDQKIEIEVGEQIQIEGKISFSDGKITNDVIWLSENDNIAKVDSQGKILGVNPGSVNIILSAKQDPKQNVKLNLKVNPFKEKNVEISGNDKINLSNEDKDYLNKYQNEINKNSQIDQTNKDVKSYPVTTLNINIYDNNIELVKDVNFEATCLTNGISWSYSKKLSNGSIMLDDVPNESLIQILVTKDNWTSRKKMLITKGLPRTKTNPLIVNFGNTEKDKFYSLQDQPEVSRVLINNKEISVTNNKSEENNGSGIILKESLNTITLYFSESVDKKSVEDSFEIISQSNQTENIKLYNKNNSLAFNWEPTFQKVDIKTYILPTTKTNYRIYFKNNFKDLDSNTSIQGKIFSFVHNEIFSEFIDITIEK